jgi:hypothetical protein
MARAVLREYRMDLMAADPAQLRAFLATRGAPADFVLPAACQSLPQVGGAALRWQDRPVSMICLRRSPNELLWVFVIERSAAADPPPSETPLLAAVGNLMTASWTRDNRSYLVAVVGDPAQIRRYL